LHYIIDGIKASKTGWEDGGGGLGASYVFVESDSRASFCLAMADLVVAIPVGEIRTRAVGARPKMTRNSFSISSSIIVGLSFVRWAKKPAPG
jgi:hypothetical protein